MTTSLYRKTCTTILEGTELNYFPLSIAQTGIIYEILILGTQDSVSTPVERAKLSKQELLGLCVQRFVTLTQESESTKNSSLQLQFISQMLLEPKVNELLYKLIGEVFPQIESPYLLTDHNTMMLFAFLVEEFSKAIS